MNILLLRSAPHPIADYIAGFIILFGLIIAVVIVVLVWIKKQFTGKNKP